MQPRSLAGLAVLAAALGIGPVSRAEPAEPRAANQLPLSGAEARGGIPAGLAPRLEVGLCEGPGETWMKTSGVDWDLRAQVFAKGWVTRGGSGADDGRWGLNYLRECDAQRYVPVVAYQQMLGEPGGGEGAFLKKVQNPATMAAYFRDFATLLQRAKEFGKPVAVLVENDGFGLLEQQSGGDPNVYAAIRDSGLPELAALPNSVAGFGLAFLRLRQVLGANKVVLGLPVSAWASGHDVLYGDPARPLAPEVHQVYEFLAPLGLGANVTGASYDFLVSAPLDRDADYYRLALGQDRWWDASDRASLDTNSFNRYASWLRLWNAKADKRWVLWQIPLGNSNSLNAYSDGGPAEGYKDNRSEYFFGSGTAHLRKFANAGVVALLFGAGTRGMASFQNDLYSDGELFLKSRAGVILNAGGVPLISNASTRVAAASADGVAPGPRSAAP